MITLSIIIPTYKGEANIAIAVKSALSQRIDGETEVIVVDDNGAGSEHQIATETILNEYIIKQQIKYIKHETNKNGSAARNTGFKVSSGEYIVFLDDDDYLFPEKTQIQIDQLEEKGEEYGFSVSAGYYVHKNGRGYLKRINHKDAFLFNYLMDRNYFNTSALVLRRKCILDIGGFDESYQRHQDWEFCSRILCETNVCYVNMPLLIKYAENRNIAPNNKIRESQLDSFLEKIQPTLEKTLSHKQIDIITRYKYRQVFCGYIISKQFSKGYTFLREHNCGNKDLFLGIVELFLFAIRRTVNGSRKVTYSFSEIKNMVLGE